MSADYAAFFRALRGLYRHQWGILCTCP